MSSKGGYAAAPPPSQGGDRFYNPPAVRRHHQQVLLQQQQQHQQNQHHHHHQLHQHQLQRRARVVAESSSSVGAEKRGDGDDSSVVVGVVALSVPRSVSPAPALKITNLDRFMESMSPFIEARFSSEVDAKGLRTPEANSCAFFYLEDLWESFSEWSVFGRGVPFLLYGTDQVEQYYVPFLSGIQLYIDPAKPSSRLRGSVEEIGAGSYRMTTSSASFEADNTNLPGLLLFQFLEREQPYNRRPLVDKVSLLASQCPELNKSRSCDLLPTSWICVAWYPIYRIPSGTTLQDLDASFLTFHSLSTHSKNSCLAPKFHAANTRKVNGYTDPTAKISLPVFALASYKLQESILSPNIPHECEQESSLLLAADNWLKRVKVMLPDYQFFRSHRR